jgi:microcompartment protein CcmK/EutM
MKKVVKILEQTLGKGNFVLISSGGPSRIKPLRVITRLPRPVDKPKVQIVDFVDERRTRL